MTNRSWRVDETYLRVAGKWTYLYRAVDSTGATIDFLLSASRDAGAAKRFFQTALRSVGHPRPRVINVDGNPSYPKVISELKRTGELGRRCRCPSGVLLEQRGGTGPPFSKTASESLSGLPVFCLGGANDSGYRDGEHDPQCSARVSLRPSKAMRIQPLQRGSHRGPCKGHSVDYLFSGWMARDAPRAAKPHVRYVGLRRMSVAGHETRRR